MQDDSKQSKEVRRASAKSERAHTISGIKGFLGVERSFDKPSDSLPVYRKATLKETILGWSFFVAILASGGFFIMRHFTNEHPPLPISTEVSPPSSSGIEIRAAIPPASVAIEPVMALKYKDAVAEKTRKLREERDRLSVEYGKKCNDPKTRPAKDYCRRLQDKREIIYKSLMTR